MSLYVNPPADSLVNPSGESLRFADYSRLPWDVLTDPKLKRLDGYVYSVLAATVWQGNYATVGTRLIAEVLHTTQRLVAASLQRLIAAGKIAKCERRRGQRAGYILVSPVFAQKQRTGAHEVALGPSGTPRLVSSPRKPQKSEKTA